MRRWALGRARLMPPWHLARSILLERRNRHAQSVPISCGTAASASDPLRALERARCALASPPARLLCVIPSAGFFGTKADLSSRLTTCATIHTNQKKGVISFDIPSQAKHNPPAALPCVHHPRTLHRAARSLCPPFWNEALKQAHEQQEVLDAHESADATRDQSA